MHYYFLAASLPDIELGQEPELSFSSLMLLFRENLSEDDMDDINRLRWLIDIDNVHKFIKDEPLNPFGLLKRKEIEEALLNRTLLPDYVFDILDQGDDHFYKIYLTFFRTEATEEKGFLKRYFAFERSLRLCLAAVRAKDTGRDLSKELADADQSDFLVRALIASKDASEPDFPFELRSLYDIVKNLSDDPFQQYCEIARYRFKKIGELAKDYPFSLEALMIYTLRLMLAEEWHLLNDEEGQKRLNALIHQKETA
ncbi:MAG: DUF2764 family protein [Chlamydiales bacterium]|nr:DUF2764 family protein [Chlamydiales bacterium]